jgi:capsular exopolysaccharide synthesis family protein
MSIEQTAPGKMRKGSLRDLLYVLFGHKKKMLAFMALLFGAVAIKTLLQPSVYRSEAKLLMRLGRESVSLDPTATVGEVVSINRSYDWEVNSELEIIKSREIAEQVIDELGTNFFLHGGQAELPTPETATAVATPTDEALQTVKQTLDVVVGSTGKLASSLGLSEPVDEREKAIRKLTDNLKATALQNTSVINITYNEQDPQAAKLVLERFIKAYLDKHVSVFCTANSQQFFERQVSQLHQKLTDMQKEFQTLKDTTGISALVEQRTVTVTAIGTLERNITEAEAELVGADAKVTGIQHLLAEVPETVVLEEMSGRADYAADLMREQLYQLQLRAKEVEGKYRPDSRQLDMVRQQVEQGQNILEKEQTKPNRTEVKKGTNNVYQQMQLALFTEQSAIAGLQSKLDKMRTQMTEATSKLRTLNQVENETTRLEREIKLLETSYGQYFTKLEEARIDQALRSDRITNVSILQAATLPVIPTGPGKVLRLALGLLLSIVGGVAFAFFCEYLDHSIKTPEDVNEKLHLTTLASIPQARANTVGPVWKSSLWKRFGMKPRQTTPVQWDLPTNMRRHYAVFREQLLLSTNGSLHGHYVLGVTSTSRSEGVSTVAANLASSLSEQGRGTILLVDANTHDPSIHRIFRTRQSPGLVDVLSANPKGNEDDTIVRRAANLNVLTAGNINGPAAKTVTSDGFVRFLESVKQNYRFIVVDMPAMDDDSSAARLAGSCDGVVLVVETERLRWETISTAKQHLQQLNTNVLGVLLNKRRFPVPNWIYAAL